MFARFQSARKFCRLALLGFFLLALAACDEIDLGSTNPGGNSGQTIDPSAPVPVALLIPRGGGNSRDDLLAASLENAARLAVADLQGAKIDLRVYGTAGNPQTAASQALQAVNDGAKIILGPVYAESANAVGLAVAGQDVNVLAFSNNPTIAGGNVFILGPTFNNTAQRLMGYSASQGRNKVVVVHATDVAGQLGRNAIQQAAAGSGATVVGTVSYELSQSSVAAAVPQVRSTVDSTGANAVFLTSTTSGALPLYAQMLPDAGVSPASTQFIGLTRWDIPAQTLSLPGVQGGWFAMPDPNRSAAFSSRYQSAYGKTPHPIGGLAFDGIAAIGALVAGGNRNALTRNALTQASGFQGATGAFRLRQDGTNQRALAIASIKGGQRVIIDPAPASFAGF